MKLLLRRAFRAALRERVDEAALAAALSSFREACLLEKEAGALNTASVFRYRKLLFAYLELKVTGVEPTPLHAGLFRRFFPCRRRLAPARLPPSRQKSLEKFSAWSATQFSAS